MAGPVITVSGPHGTGKSTYAKALADALGLRYISAGELFRDLAKERRMTLEEFSKAAAGDATIDKAIDERTKAEAKKGNVVIDAQLAAWMARDHADVRVLLLASDDVRFRRIAERDKISSDLAKEQTLARELIQKQRYEKHYGIDITDLTIYDLKIDTGVHPIEKTKAVVIESVRNFLARKRSY